MGEKKLLVIRHAKAVQHSYEDDFNRNLRKKAEGQIMTMSAVLKNLHILPDLVLSSAALRTQQTTEGFAKHLGFDKEKILLKKSMYNTDVSTLIKEINEVSKEINTLFLVGHNPTVGMLVDDLTGDFGHHFSTCALALLHFEIDSWAEVMTNTAKLIWLKETQTT